MITDDMTYHRMDWLMFFQMETRLVAGTSINKAFDIEDVDSLHLDENCTDDNRRTSLAMTLQIYCDCDCDCEI